MLWAVKSIFGSQYNYIAGPEGEWFYIEAIGSTLPNFIDLYLKAEGLFWLKTWLLVEASQILGKLLDILDKCQSARNTGWIVWGAKGLWKCSCWCSSVTLSQVFQYEVLQAFFGSTSQQECRFSSFLWTSNGFSWCLGLGRPFSNKLLLLCVPPEMSVIQMSWWKQHWWLSTKCPKPSPNFSVEQGSTQLLVLDDQEDCLKPRDILKSVIWQSSGLSFVLSTERCM